MITFKEEKEYAIKMWKEIKRLLIKRSTFDLYYSAWIVDVKKSIVEKYNAELNKKYNAKSKQYELIINWMYDCIMCERCGKHCSRCTLTTGFDGKDYSCTTEPYNKNSPYAIVQHTLADAYRSKAAIAKAQEACDIIIAAIKMLE